MIRLKKEAPMKDVMPFAFDDCLVRAVTREGEPWFNAKDVCTALGFANPWQAVETHVEKDDLQKLEVIDSFGRAQSTNHVSESGLYALIFGSTKPEAKRFKKWVTSEVLPSIRKTGGYSVEGAGGPTVGLGRYRIILLEKLHSARDPAIRHALYEQLDQVSRQMGITTPALETIGREHPQVPDIVTEFFDSLAYVQAQGRRLNHSKNASLLAINLPEVMAVFRDLGQPVRQGMELRRTLRQSRSPRWREAQVVNSAITGSSVRCLVFEQAE